MSEHIHPSLFRLIGQTELPNKPILSHHLAANLRQKNESVMSTFDPSTRAVLSDPNYRAGRLSLASHGLVTLITGISQGYAHIATAQIQELRETAMSYQAHPLTVEDPSWDSKEQRIVSLVYDQQARSIPLGRQAGLNPSELGLDLSALLELSVESHSRAHRQTPSTHRKSVAEIYVGEGALALLTSVELAAQQIWATPELLRARLAEVVETYDTPKKWEEIYDQEINRYKQRGILGNPATSQPAS